jgi:flagellar hook-associated protein 1 FlgK
MPTLSSGINIALQAILSQSQSIEITEHNVANVDTKGYHRQKASLTARVANPSVSYDLGYSAGQMGAGVTVDRIQRFSLDFFDGRFRSVSADTKSWEYQGEILSQIESTLSDLTDDGLSPKLDQFWLSWQNLASDPTNSTIRTEVMNDAASLCEKFNRNAQQLVVLRQDQNLTLENHVSEINSLAKSIASLNAEISRVIGVNQQPNDLLDQRDLALDRLAELTGAVSSTQANGEVIVSINGHVLVTGRDSLTLKTEPDPDPKNIGVDRIVWEKDSSVFTPAGGEVEGILKVRDFYIPNQIAALDDMAKNIVTEVNKIHTQGYCLDGSKGGDFFASDGLTALEIKLADGLEPEKIAAAGAPDTAGEVEVGNSENAELMVALRQQKIPGLKNLTFNEYCNGMMSELASTVSQANTNGIQHTIVLKALGEQRESVSGVVLDEEAANLAKSQKAYQAAARVMNAYDELLDLVINRMGLVGR